MKLQTPSFFDTVDEQLFPRPDIRKIKKVSKQVKVQLPQGVIDSLVQSEKHVLISKLFVTKRTVKNIISQHKNKKNLSQKT